MRRALLLLLWVLPASAQNYEYIRPGYTPTTNGGLPLLPRDTQPQILPPPPRVTSKPEIPKSIIRKPKPAKKPVLPLKAKTSSPLLPKPLETALLPLVRPVPLGEPILRYPETARSAGQEGQVIVRVYLDEKGQVLRTKVMRSSGVTELDQAAEQAVQQMQFKPAHRGLEPVAAKADIPVNFRLS